MNLGKTVATLVTAPARAGLTVAEASLAVAGAGVGLARRALGDTADPTISPVANLLGIDSTIEKANRLARLLDDDTPLGRAVAPGGLIDQLLAEEGLVERLLSEDGLAERLMAKGGLIDMLTAHNGPLEQTVFVAETLNRLGPNPQALSP